MQMQTHTPKAWTDVRRQLLQSEQCGRLHLFLSFRDATCDPVCVVATGL